MINEDDSMKNLTDEQKQKYITDLQQSKASHSTSVQASNTAAARDVHATLNRIFHEVRILSVKFTSKRLNSLHQLKALAVRTGIYACVFASCGHVYDTYPAAWFGTDNTMDFWEDRLKLQPDFIVKQLKLWACNENKSRLSAPLTLSI